MAAREPAQRQPGSRERPLGCRHSGVPPAVRGAQLSRDVPHPGDGQLHTSSVEGFARVAVKAQIAGAQDHVPGQGELGAEAIAPGSLALVLDAPERTGSEREAPGEGDPRIGEDSGARAETALVVADDRGGQVALGRCGRGEEKEPSVGLRIGPRLVIDASTARERDRPGRNGEGREGQEDHGDGGEVLRAGPAPCKASGHGFR